MDWENFIEYTYYLFFGIVGVWSSLWFLVRVLEAFLDLRELRKKGKIPFAEYQNFSHVFSYFTAILVFAMITFAIFTYDWSNFYPNLPFMVGVPRWKWWQVILEYIKMYIWIIIFYGW